MGLIVVTPYFRGTTDPRAAILCEEHADIVLPVLKLATESAYTDFLKYPCDPGSGDASRPVGVDLPVNHAEPSDDLVSRLKYFKSV